MLEHCCRDLFPFSHKNINEVRHWCWAIRPRSQRSNSSQRCLMGLRLGLCADLSSSSTPISTNHFCMDLALCTGELWCLNKKEPSPNCYQNVVSAEDFPSLNLRGQAQTIKNSPRPLFFLHQTLQLALCIGAGSVLQASSKLRLVWRIARLWSVIHYSRERVSTAQESNGGELYATPANACHCTWWS
jgi:hypothetical protein